MGKLSVSHQGISPGRARPSRQGISPSSSPAVSQSDPAPCWEIPLSISQQHTPCLRESLLLGGESLSWEVSGSCPAFIPAGADGAASPHPGAAPHPPLPASPVSWGAQGEGSLWGERCMHALGERGASSHSSQKPPARPRRHRCLGWAPGWSQQPLCIPAGVGTAPGQRRALAGPSEPGPRAGRAATWGTKRPPVWGPARAAASRSCVQVTEARSETGLGIVWGKRRS